MERLSVVDPFLGTLEPTSKPASYAYPNPFQTKSRTFAEIPVREMDPVL